jgi:fructose-1,6-bisphosphatase/inositol monophosphatase family enzyme
LLPKPADYYVGKLRELHDRMQTDLLHHLREQEESTADVGNSVSAENDLAGVADVRGGDTIYTIDAHSEEILFDFCETWSREIGPFVLISEGIEDAGWRAFPDGASVDEGSFLLIIDPIDGTRNIMYNKRSAWILSGIAPNNGPATNLADIEAAVMTELPTTRHRVADQLWATKGGGAFRESRDVATGERKPLPFRPSQSPTLAHGFASIAKFFPPAKAEIAAFESKLFDAVLDSTGENPLIFDDEYICTGGQLYEILVGHDRFIADLRPVFFGAYGLPKKLVCHPYDICTELIAREVGVIVTDEHGAALSAPLDIRADVSWVGYANPTLRNTIAPELAKLLAELPQG